LLSSERKSRNGAESVIMSPGNLAKAAPKALADLTAATLIETRKPRHKELIGYETAEAFTYADKQFLSPSPARGPFLDLLRHSPKDGLALIRKLVVHACAFHNDERPASAGDTVTIELETGPRNFPYPTRFCDVLSLAISGPALRDIRLRGMKILFFSANSRTGRRQRWTPSGIGSTTEDLSRHGRIFRTR